MKKWVCAITLLAPLIAMGEKSVDERDAIRRLILSGEISMDTISAIALQGLFGNMSDEFIFEERREGNRGATGLKVMQLEFDESCSGEVANVTVLEDGGFGDVNNRYAWSTTTHPVSGNLYMGTLNSNFLVTRIPSYVRQIGLSEDPILSSEDAFSRLLSGSPVSYSTGGEIWKYNFTTKTWAQSFKAPSSNFVGARKMVQYQDTIIAALSNGPNGPSRRTLRYDIEELYLNPENEGPKLYKLSEDETSWEELDDGGLIGGTQRSIRSMCVSSVTNKLYFGTEGYGVAKLLTYDGSDIEVIFESTEILALAECHEYEPGKLLFGSWDLILGWDLLLLDETSDFSITSIRPNITTTDATGIMEMRSFNGWFYTGILNYQGGFAIIRTQDILDINSWEFVTLNGFEEEQMEQTGSVSGRNVYPWSSAVVCDTYYLGTYNLDRGLNSEPFAQLWSTKDGTNWTLVNRDAFGQKGAFGYRVMQVIDGKLIIGTANSLFIADFSSPPFGGLRGNDEKN